MILCENIFREIYKISAGSAAAATLPAKTLSPARSLRGVFPFFFYAFPPFAFLRIFAYFFILFSGRMRAGFRTEIAFCPASSSNFFSSAFPFARRIPGRFQQSARSRARRFFARFPLLTFRSDVRPGTPRESFFPRSENFCDKFCVKGLKNTLKNVIIETDYVIFARLREKFPFFRGNRAFT